MKTLIVYYSLNGNTEYAVGRIAEKTGADTLRVEPKRKYPKKGFMKFLVGGRSVMKGDKPELMPYSVDLDEYERVVIASPIWASYYAPPIATFISENAGVLKGKPIAYIFSSAGGDTVKAVEKLKKELHIDSFFLELSLVDPKTRPSEENERRMAEFIEKLL